MLLLQLALILNNFLLELIELHLTSLYFLHLQYNNRLGIASIEGFDSSPVRYNSAVHLMLLCHSDLFPFLEFAVAAAVSLSPLYNSVRKVPMVKITVLCIVELFMAAYNDFLLLCLNGLVSNFHQML